MKIVESWLREWVNPDLTTDELAHQLTMLGLEVDDITVEGDGLDGIVIAEVVEVARHPDADRLSVCKVSTGGKRTVDVVCGAPNVVQGMKSPLAVPGLRLPNGVELRKADIRGVPSNGMLCSAIELGLGDESDGIIALPDDAPVGMALLEYLSLPDAVINLDLTPNRGDCFSVLGVAREVAAKTGCDLNHADVGPIEATTEDVLPVEIPFPAGCPSFANACAGPACVGFPRSSTSPTTSCWNWASRCTPMTPPACRARFGRAWRRKAKKSRCWTRKRSPSTTTRWSLPTTAAPSALQALWVD
jgi:phenylalanyl-tRNA synthetase beta chain